MVTDFGIPGKVGSLPGAMKGGRNCQLIAPRRAETFCSATHPGALHYFSVLPAAVRKSKKYASPESPPKKGRFGEGSVKPRKGGRKQLKSLSKPTLDFSLAKGESAVEFREGS
jgi:hypothetical protein